MRCVHPAATPGVAGSSAARCVEDLRPSRPRHRARHAPRSRASKAAPPPLSSVAAFPRLPVRLRGGRDLPPSPAHPHPHQLAPPPPPRRQATVVQLPRPALRSSFAAALARPPPRAPLLLVPRAPLQRQRAPVRAPLPPAPRRCVPRARPGSHQSLSRRSRLLRQRVIRAPAPLPRPSAPRGTRRARRRALVARVVAACARLLAGCAPRPFAPAWLRK